MTKRVYTISFEAVAVTAVQDLIAVYAGASMPFEVHAIQLGQITATVVGNLNLSLKRLPATVTAGSGGGAGTLVAASPSDAAATVTARINDTTQATTSGTVAKVLVDVYNVINGYQWIFPPDDRPECGLNQAIVLSLDTAPGSSETMSGTLTIAELI